MAEFLWVEMEMCADAHGGGFALEKKAVEKGVGNFVLSKENKNWRKKGKAARKSFILPILEIGCAIFPSILFCCL
jgi:hypothetical protein